MGARPKLAWQISKVSHDEEEENTHVRLERKTPSPRPSPSSSSPSSSLLSSPSKTPPKPTTPPASVPFRKPESPKERAGMGLGAWVGGLGSGLGSRAGFLLAALVAYLLLGGLLFQFLEHDAREGEVLEASEEMEEDRASLLKSLWAETVSKSEEDWVQVANERLDLYDNDLKEFLAKGVDLEDEDDDNPWTLLGSIFYCFTVVTTIGYGNIYPVTTLGRMATIVYGLVGIPLTIIYLNEVGSWVTKRLKRLLSRKWPEMDGDSGEFDFSLGLGVTLTILYLLAGAVVFDLLEDDWDFIDAAYFSFVSFSTIGFGDLIPDEEWWMLALMLYSLSALSLCASCFGLIQASLDSTLTAKHSQIQEWYRGWSSRRSAGAAKKDDDAVAEEDEDTANYTWGT